METENKSKKLKPLASIIAGSIIGLGSIAGVISNMAQSPYNVQPRDKNAPIEIRKRYYDLDSVFYLAGHVKSQIEINSNYLETDKGRAVKEEIDNLLKEAESLKKYEDSWEQERKERFNKQSPLWQTFVYIIPLSVGVTLVTHGLTEYPRRK